MKKIELEINSCEGCPYCHYDCYYDRSHGSGWDCEHPNAEHSRIIDEGPTNGTPESIQNTKKIREILENRVPMWCPLPDIGIKENNKYCEGNIMNNKVDKIGMIVVEDARDWPAKNKMADFESIINPLRKALQTAMDRKDEVYNEGIEWTGLKQGKKNSGSIFQPQNALHSINLKYSNTEQGRDVFTEILSIAIQLGIEQGRREMICDLKEISFVFVSETGKEMIDKIINY